MRRDLDLTIVRLLSDLEADLADPVGVRSYVHRHHVPDQPDGLSLDRSMTDRALSPTFRLVVDHDPRIGLLESKADEIPRRRTVAVDPVLQNRKVMEGEKAADNPVTLDVSTSAPTTPSLVIGLGGRSGFVSGEYLTLKSILLCD
jgi:hypothetical protein